MKITKTFVEYSIVAVVGALAMTSVTPSQAAYGSRAQCYDGVTSACNKFGEPRRSACIRNGYSQCDGRFKAPGAGGGADGKPPARPLTVKHR